MKLLARMFLLSVFFWIPASHSPICGQGYPPPEGKLSSKYDLSSNKTTIDLQFLQVAEQRDARLYLTLKAQYTGQMSKRPPVVGFVFSSWSQSGYAFENGCTLNTTADGVRMPAVDMQFIDKRTAEGKNVSSVLGVIAYEDFVQMVRAKKVEMRLCETTFTLTDSAMQTLKSFGREIYPDDFK